MSLQIVILAAGAGKRMFSKQAKVVHTLAGKALLRHVIETAVLLKPAAIHVIYGHQGTQLKEALKDTSVNWIHQKEQLGTGHALLQALPFIPAQSEVLILSADVPLILLSTLEKLIQTPENAPSLALLVATLDNPTGLGRIIRDKNQKICAIVEEKDASIEQKKIKEIYSGICCLTREMLHRWLPQLDCNNAQGEYYLTDIIALAVKEKTPIISIEAMDAVEVQGVNNRLQLQQLERIWQLRNANTLLLKGVSIADATRIDVRGELICGQDVSIDVNCVFIGKVSLADDCSIGPNCVLTNVSLEAGTHVYAHSVLENCHIGQHCHIGPFARLRPGTYLKDHCKIGNFVETKNAQFGEGSKANHLSYLGDVSLGKNVNVGAGTITCNYDGVNKHQTLIGDNVNIGSDTQLIAPVTVGDHATIGAGSTICKDVPANKLTFTESRQVTHPSWERPAPVKK